MEPTTIVFDPHIWAAMVLLVAALAVILVVLVEGNPRSGKGGLL